MPSSSHGSANWRQNNDPASPHSSRAVGIFLLLIFVAGVVWFLSNMRVPDPQRLFVSSVTLSGYSEKNAHLPKIHNAFPGRDGILNALTSRLRVEQRAAEKGTLAGTVNLTEELNGLFKSKDVAEEQDVRLVFFTGHAIAWPSGEGQGHEVQLVTSEYSPVTEEGRKAGRVPLRALLEQFAKQGPSRKVLVLDLFRLRLDPWLSVQNHALPRHVEKLVQSLGYDNLWVVLPCSEGERSYMTGRLAAVLDESADRESVFEAAVRSTLCDEAATAAGDTELTLSAAFESIKKDVADRTGGLQTPQLIHAGELGQKLADDLVLARISGEQPNTPENESSGERRAEPQQRPSTAKPDEGEPWWKQSSPKLSNDPRRFAAAYSPIAFRTIKPRWDDEASPRRPPWEKWISTAEQRRSSLESLLLGAAYADRCVWLAAEAQPYSEPLSGLVEKTTAFISALERGLLGKPSIEELDNRVTEAEGHHQQLTVSLAEALHRALDDLRQAINVKNRWDFRAELVAAAILESRCLSRATSEAAKAEARAMLNPVTKAMTRVSERPSGRRQSMPLTTAEVEALYGSLCSLGGLQSVSMDEITAWLHKFKPNAPGQESWQGRLRFLVSDSRSFRGVDIEDPLPLTSASLGVPSIANFALVELGEDGAWDIVCGEKGDAQTPLRLRFGGDQLPVDSEVRLTAHYDDKLLDKLVYDGIAFKNGAYQSISIDSGFQTEGSIDVQLSEAGAASKGSSAVEFIVTDSSGNKLLEPIRLNVFPESADRSTVTIERKSFEANGQQVEWIHDDRTFGIYADWPNTIRVRLKNQRAKATSYGVVVYPFDGETVPSVKALLTQPPAAVGYAPAVKPEETVTVSFATLPDATAADEESEAEAAPDDRLLAKLRALEAKRENAAPSVKVKRLAIIVYEQSGEARQRVVYDAKLLSPADFFIAVPGRLDRDNEGEIDLTPDPGAGWPASSPPKQLGEAVLAMTPSPNMPSVRLDESVAELSMTKPTRLPITFRPADLTEREIPRLHVDLGTYKRAFSYVYDKSEAWYPASEPFVSFFGLINKDGKTKTLDPKRGAYLVTDKDLPVSAEFACDPGRRGLAKAVALNGDGSVRSPGHETVEGRSFTAEMALAPGSSAFTLTVSASHLRIPVKIPIPIMSRSDRSYQRRVRVKIDNTSSSLPLVAVTPLIIFDQKPPRLDIDTRLTSGGRPPHNVAQSDQKGIRVEFDYEERHSGLAKLSACWDIDEDGVCSEDEKPFTVKLVDLSSVGKFDATTAQASVPLKGLNDLEKDTLYRLLLMPEDYAGNEGVWCLAATVLVEKPRTIAKAPTRKRPAKSAAQVKPKVNDHKLRVRVFYPAPSGVPVSGDDRLEVTAVGPKTVSLKYARGTWQAERLPAGSYDIKVVGSVGGNQHHGEAKGIATSRRGTEVGKVVLIKGLPKAD